MRRVRVIKKSEDRDRLKSGSNRKRAPRESIAKNPPRPFSSKETLRSIREWARTSGMLPHEFFLRIMRGEPVVMYDGEKEYKYYPTYEERYQAGKECAEFFVPKLNRLPSDEQQERDDLAARNNSSEPQKVLYMDTKMLEGLTPDELQLLQKVLDPKRRSEGHEVDEPKADPWIYASTLH